MKAELQNDVRNVLTLFAGFLIGMHLAVFLHELGHALGYWLSGGHVVAIVMQAPLPAGHVLGNGPNRFLPVWGGVAFGSLITAAPLLMAWQLSPRSPVRFAALMTAAFCLGHNGMYLFVGSIVPFADALNMISLGAPRWLLFLLGAPLLIAFVLVLTSAIRAVGVRATESVWKRILVAELGLLSFPGVMVVSMLFMPVPAEVRLPTITFVCCYAVCFGVAEYRACDTDLSGVTGHARIQMPPNWTSTLALLAAAGLVIGLEWLAFGRV